MMRVFSLQSSKLSLVACVLSACILFISAGSDQRGEQKAIQKLDANEQHRKRKLHEKIERELDYLRRDDMCMDGDTYERCDRDKLKEILRECPRDICLFRLPRSDSSRRDPEFVIDYNGVYCTNPGTNCDRCWEGKWCRKPARCIHRDFYRRYERRNKLKKICKGGWVSVKNSSDRKNGYER